MSSYVYILRCGDGSFYTGWTNDLEKRTAAHNDGRGARYTQSRRPVKLIYSEKVSSKNEALRREREIKKMTRAAKQNLLEGTEVKAPGS